MLQLQKRSHPYMKSFIILFFISLSLWSAEVDTKLYDGNNTTGYYEEVKKLIDKEEPQDQTDVERIATERLILEKLTKLLSFEPKKDSLPDSLLPDDQNMSTENYLSYLNALTHTYSTIETLKEEESIMQSKRKFLKSSINDITIEDKKNLLLYQLQYAFYKLKGNNHNLSVKNYETLLVNGELRFKQALNRVDFNIGHLEQKLTDTNKKFTEVEQKLVALNLAKERELIYSDTITEPLHKKFLENTTNTTSLVTTKIDQKLLLSLAYLQKEKGQKSLDYLMSAREDAESLSPDLQKYYNYKIAMLKSIFKDIAGNVALALSNVENSAEDVYEYIYTKLTDNIFVFNEQGISALDIGKVILILIFGFMFASFYKRKIMNFAIKREKISITSAKVHIKCRVLHHCIYYYSYRAQKYWIRSIQSWYCCRSTFYRYRFWATNCCI